MAWYHEKCEAAGVPHHEKVMPHSFRIGGATALFSQGVTAEEIKTMGRWASDVYRIYCRLSKERLLELSHRMSNSRSTQFLNGVDGFFRTAGSASELDIEEVEQPEPGQQPEPDENEGDGDDDGLGSESDGGSDDGTGMTDAEFCAAIRPRATTAAAGSAAASMSPPSIEDLFSLDDDDDEMTVSEVTG